MHSPFGSFLHASCLLGQSSNAKVFFDRFLAGFFRRFFVVFVVALACVDTFFFAIDRCTFLAIFLAVFLIVIRFDFFFAAIRRCYEVFI